MKLIIILVLSMLGSSALAQNKITKLVTCTAQVDSNDIDPTFGSQAQIEVDQDDYTDTNGNPATSILLQVSPVTGNLGSLYIGGEINGSSDNWATVDASTIRIHEYADDEGSATTYDATYTTADKKLVFTEAEGLIFPKSYTMTAQCP